MENRKIIEKATTKTITIGIENLDLRPSLIKTPFINY